MKSKLASAVFTAVLLALAKCQTYPRFMHGDKVLANNSYIFRDAIGEAGDANTLKCVTDFANCCRSGEYSGSWYDEQGQEVQFEGNVTTTFYITAGDGEISLNRRRDYHGGSVGLWRCDIPDISGIKKSLYIYIGTYAEGEGTLDGPMVISYTTHIDHQKLYQDPQFTLTCRSEGGPVTTVEWKRKIMRRKYVIVEDDRDHETSQLILSTSRVTVYENRLRVRGREGGEYKCRISNNIPDYFKNRTYLSHKTSSFTVEVAKTPRDLTILRDSNTSLYVGWNLPSTIPIGYVIYYWLDRADIQQVNVSNGTTQHYVLEGLETGANYSVSMLALSQHLPSATVGSPIISVADLIPSVVVSTVNENPVAGTPYILNCTVTLLPGMTVIPVVFWEGPGVDDGAEINDTTSSGEVHSRLLSFRHLTIAHGGKYVCTANYTLYRETSRNGSDSLILSVIIPQSSMSINVIADRPVTYVGNNITLECIIKLNNAISNSDVEMNAVWLKEGRGYSGQSTRVIISHDVSGNTTHTTITFNYLMSSDKGRYQCKATLVPLLGNSRPKVESRFHDLTTIVPSLIVQTSPSIVRILDVWPHNQFILTCTARAQVKGENVPIQMNIKWTKRVEIQTDSGRQLQYTDVPTEHYTVSGSSNNNYGYQSILAVNNETNAVGKTSYRCRATIERNTNDFKHTSRDSQIAVVGPTNPVLPVFVRVTASNSSSATIQWMISSIAYTPETYVVRYGTNFEELNMTSEEQHSGSNIRILDTIYTTELSNLQPSVIYFYRITANNSVRTTSSSVRMLITKELLTIESSGDVYVGQPHTLSCIAAESTSGRYTSLMWVDRNNHILRRSDGSGSRLELEFSSFTLSDVSNYTCKVAYSNGDSRELTKEIIATVPPPHISLEMIEGLDMVYAGLNLTLQCNVTLVNLSDVHVDISLEWFKSGDKIKTCSELQRISGDKFHCYMYLTHLSYKDDNGSYSCMALITPKQQYSFLKAQTVISNTLDLNVTVPIVTVEMSSFTRRLLDVSPYNQFTGSCSATVTIPGLDGPLRLSTDWQWRRKEESKRDFSDVTDMSIDNGFMSTLTNTEVRNGTVIYQCVFSLEGVDNISTYDTATISVIGVRAPATPMGVLISQIFPDNAIIQWTIPAIVYTPESYLVVYGAHPDSLLSSTETLSSGDDITAIERVYRVQLKDLKPGTKYYFFVASVNSYNLSQTELSFFYTKEIAPGPVSFINVMRLNDTSWSISWGPAQPPNGNITHYLVWVNSTSDSHLRTVPLPTSREVIISGLTYKAMYKVYIAAVNGAGIGEWRETQDVILTERLGGRSNNDEGDGSGGTVGAILAVVLLLTIIGIIVGVVISLYIRKRRLVKKHILQIEDKERSPQLNNAVKEGMVEAENESTEQKRVPDPTKTNGVSGCAGTKEDGSTGPVNSEKKERGAESAHTTV